MWKGSWEGRGGEGVERGFFQGMLGGEEWGGMGRIRLGTLGRDGWGKGRLGSCGVSLGCSVRGLWWRDTGIVGVSGVVVLLLCQSGFYAS